MLDLAGWEVKIPGSEESGFEKLRSALITDEQPWHVLHGCKPVSNACQNCMAKEAFEKFEKQAGRAFAQDAWKTPRPWPDALKHPENWKPGQRVVVAPQSDLFQPGVTDDYIDRVMKVIGKHQEHLFFITTKHPERMRRYCMRQMGLGGAVGRLGVHWPMPNARFGVSVENFETYAQRVPYLFETPVAFRYVIVEPLLEYFRLAQIMTPTRDILWPLKGILQQYLGLDPQDKPLWLPLNDPLRAFPKLDWIVIGGEHGPRQPHPKWVKAMALECLQEGIPVNFKGFGNMHPTGKPDRDNDFNLVIVSADGTRRGKGMGSAINFVAPDPDGQDTFFTRAATPEHPLRTSAGGTRFADYPAYSNPKTKIRITDISQTARNLQQLVNHQAMIVDPNAPTTAGYILERKGQETGSLEKPGSFDVTTATQPGRRLHDD